MLDGVIPYVGIWDRKPVGLFLIYAAIRELGGEGTIQYQLVAALCVALTALLVWRYARRLASPAGAGAAGIAYILWLNLTEGEGGQSPVFYNLPMMAAALLVARALESPGSCRGGTARLGCAAMLACGLALQIKYTIVFEAAWFGAALLWALRREGAGALALAGWATLWAATAWLPTALAALVYWRIGALHQFVFANFQSIFGRGGNHAAAPLGWALLLAILSPLLAAIAVSAREGTGRSPLRRFTLLWLGVALVAIVPFVAAPNPHPLMPVLLPAVIAAAPPFGAHRRAAAALLLVIALAGQIVLAINRAMKGGHAEALALAAAARPRSGCLYVFDGYPALYRLVGGCLPSPYVFPGHLNKASENSADALGVDPEAEVRRILAARPGAIVDAWPAYARGNPRTRAMVQAALRRDYRLVLRLRTGDRDRLVYRLRQ